MKARLFRTVGLLVSISSLSAACTADVREIERATCAINEFFGIECPSSQTDTAQTKPGELYPELY